MVSVYGTKRDVSAWMCARGIGSQGATTVGIGWVNDGANEVGGE